MTLKNKNLGNVSLTSAKRFVMMKLDPGKKFNNYYWLEGPLPSDKGRRITVNHDNQSQQCSRCLLTAENGCLGFGNGKMCEENKGVRAKMSDYLNFLKNTIGYCTLKELYSKEMSRLYNNFEGDVRMTSDADMDQYIEENLENFEPVIPVITVSNENDVRNISDEGNTLNDKEAEINVNTKKVESLKVEKVYPLKKELQMWKS